MLTNQLVISDIIIRQDAAGRYCLNDLHRAAGNVPKQKPSEWLRNKQATELITEIEKAGIPAIQSKQQVGTFAVKPMVYAYAMWISSKFHLHVIEAYDAMVTGAYNQEPIATTPKPLPSEQLIEHDRDRVVLIREIAAKTRAFRRCRNRLERESLASCLMNLNNMAGFLHLNAMILEELPLAALPLAPDCDSGDVLKQFWHNYTILSGAERLNHSRHRGEIAINIKEFTLACQREGLALADSNEIYTCLPLSQSPYPLFVKANYSLGSALVKNKVLKCWLFKTISDGGVL